MNNLISIFAILFSICFTVNSQTRNVRHYTINEGLSNNAVYSISQDEKGRMWFGTIDGIHSFDGNEISVWRDDQIKSLGSCIYTIQQDDNQQLWIGSDQGLSIFNLRTETFSTLDNQTKSGMRINTPVSHVITDRKKNVWIATVGQGLFRYEPHTDELFQYAALGKINSDFISYIMEDRSGAIWIASMNDGVSKYMPAEDLFEKATTDGTKNIVTLFEDSQQNIWVGSSGNGLFLLDKKENKLIQKLKSINSNSMFQVRSIVEWIPGILYIASDEGLTRYNIITEEKSIISSNYNQPNRLNDSYLQTLFIDREQALWIGTYFGGVNYYPPVENNFIHHYEGNSQLDGRIISVFAKADNENLWVGTDDAGFFFWNRKNHSFKSYQPKQTSTSPTYHNIHALLEDEDKLYIGMYMGGLDILNLKTGKFQNYKSSNSHRSLYASGVYSLYKDFYHQLWVGTTSGLNKYISKTDDFERIEETHRADISSILEDRKGYLWVCSLNRGVYRLNQKTQEWKHFSTQMENEENKIIIPSDKIITLCLDGKDNLWLGTDGLGLIKYDYMNELFTKVDLPKNIRVIHKIISDKDDLWLTTSNGLYCYKSESNRTIIFNRYDGLQGNQFLPNSGIQLSDGTVFIGGINGFNEFHPDRIDLSPHFPPVILSGFQLFNKPVKVDDKNSPISVSITYTDQLTLKHRHSIFSLSVATLSYINPTKNQYRYKLEGFESDWTEKNSAPHVTYTNLPSGNYTFRVSSSNGDGVWNEDAIALPIKILPPWWASMPFIILYVCLVLGILTYLYYQMNKRHHKKLKMMAFEKDKEIYQSKIDFFTHITHEIRTPLTLILAPLENVMRSKKSVQEVMPQLLVIERNGKRLLGLVNQLMDFRKIEAGGMILTLADTDVKTVLTKICKRFSVSAELKKIQIILNMPNRPCLAKLDQEAFTKIVSNLLSNALKFTDSHIWIDLITTNDRKLELRIKDNGHGIALEEHDKIFTPFYQIRKDMPSDDIGTGVGLLLVKKLIDLMNGEFKLESEVGIGSTFIIWFELSEEVDELKEKDIPDEISNMEIPMDENERKPYHILVVDDNWDLLEYLKILLSPNYEVTCASNGKEALESLISFSPDLIISDIMMPVMDGVEFCKRVKQNLQTSHIPVILLTAKAETSDHVEGLQTGADLYITKPFSSDIILAQITSLFINRENLKRSFSSEPLTHLKPITNSQIDEIFLDKVSKIIEDRISDSSFTVDTLAQEVGISRTGFFTKIKAISGMTPNDYIRIIRLKKAAELLSTKDMQVSEACFQVGFSSASYFAKCFQAQFGMLPTEFIRRKLES